MGGFRAEPGQWGSHALVELSDEGAGRKLRIALRGATVIGLEQAWQGQTIDLAAGYHDAQELDTRPGSRFAVMAPFANRIADARYSFDGVAHDLQPGVAPAERAARHGFVRGVDFELTALEADDTSARASLTTRAIRPGVHAGYPFAVDLTMTYVLNAQGLEVQATMHNVGDTAAPCFFGWHPYFRLGATPVDSWELQVPASTLVRTDAQLLPLPGDAARVPLDTLPDLDFRRMQSIGPRQIDAAYADLKADADGRIRTRMRDPESGLAIAVWQASGVMLVFTADTAARDARKSVALEPMEGWADAFNRPDCAQAIRLAPGQVRTYRCGVEIELP